MKRILILSLAVLACACVSTKRYNTLRGDKMRVDSELADANGRIDQLTAQNGQLGNERDSLTVLLIQNRAQLDQLTTRFNTLDANYKKLVATGSADAARMLLQLESTQNELAARSRKIEELNQMLAAREQAIEDIRMKVSDALVGFEGKGLTITKRDGRVYVSMEDKLLFRSGSYAIDPQGEQAVRNLSAVLATNPDINVMVEGHTDNVPFRPSGNLLDNLDLSVKRATTVVRLLLTNTAITPERITTAGRGEWLPIDSNATPEGRAKNRRTEIILSPRIDALMGIISDK